MYLLPWTLLCLTEISGCENAEGSDGGSVDATDLDTSFDTDLPESSPTDGDTDVDGNASLDDDFEPIVTLSVYEHADVDRVSWPVTVGVLISTIATGHRAGKKVLRFGNLSRNAPWNTRKRPLGAHIDGFDLHASTALDAGDRSALESLLRYQLRPPLSKARLSRLDDGRIKLRLRKPWSDGTSHLILEPHELIEKLVALVPRPETNLIVYHGCFAPRAKDRESIVAYGRPKTPIELDLPLFQHDLFDDEDDPERVTNRYYSHSELMLKVFGIDVLECPKCSSRLRFIQAVTEPLVVTALLASIGLLYSKPSAPPGSSRGPLQIPLFSKAELYLFSFQPHPFGGLATSGCRSPPS